MLYNYKDESKYRVKVQTEDQTEGCIFFMHICVKKATSHIKKAETMLYKTMCNTSSRHT